MDWEMTEALAARREELTKDGYEAYCLFCATGRETAVAQEINAGREDILAMPLIRLMHKARGGQKRLEQDVLLKGYVFLFCKQAPGDAGPTIRARQAYKILNQEYGAAALVGDDRRYAQWLLSLGGILGASKALRTGSRVTIVEGPLKEMEGLIKEYSKKNRNCRVEMDIVGKQLSVWLPFDWVEGEGSTPGACAGGE